jgi:hypothetical protein
VRLPTHEAAHDGSVGPLHACIASARTVDFHMAQLPFRIMETAVAALQHELSFDRKLFHIVETYA